MMDRSDEVLAVCMQIRDKLNARHTLWGIALLLLIQNACLTATVHKTEQRLKDIPACVEQK